MDFPQPEFHFRNNILKIAPLPPQRRHTTLD
jgi:hypothetical protein